MDQVVIYSDKSKQGQAKKEFDPEYMRRIEQLKKRDEAQ